MADFSIERRDWDDPAGERLRQAQRDELVTRYGGDEEPGPKPSAADIDLFLVATASDGTALGCGALRRLSAGSAEVKRMYVIPDSRGTGVATAVLRALEEAAATNGWHTLRLETGTKQPDARRFYEREGYAEIPNFGSYVGAEFSVCYERRLRS